VSSCYHKADLDRQVARLNSWAAGVGGLVVRVEAEVGSGMAGFRAKVRCLLVDPDGRCSLKMSWPGGKMVA
jgi:putative resolvase